MGASILPVTIYNNKIMFLFGKERDIDDNPGWSDFGGGTDSGESFLQTAVREGGEELTGFLGNNSDIRKMLKKYGTYNIDYNSDNHSTYRVHIFPIKYDSQLDKYYNNNQTFLQTRLDKQVIFKSKIFEKTQIKWFSFKDIVKKHKEFRNFYQNIIELLLLNKKGIVQFITKSFNKQTLRHKKQTLRKQTLRNKTRKFRNV